MTVIEYCGIQFLIEEKTMQLGPCCTEQHKVDTHSLILVECTLGQPVHGVASYIIYFSRNSNIKIEIILVMQHVCSRFFAEKLMSYDSKCPEQLKNDI